MKYPKLTKSILSTQRGNFGIYRTTQRRTTTLICLGGGPGNDHRVLVPRILSLYENFDLILIDPRGTGLSQEPNQPDYSFDAYVKDVIAITESLNFSPTDEIGLYGFSFGGFVALATLASAGQPFSFGVISNAATTLSTTASFTKECEHLGITNKIDELQKKIMAGNASDDTLKELFKVLAPIYLNKIPLEVAHTLIDSWGSHLFPYINTLQDMISNVNLTHHCQTIKTPCLVLGSAADCVIPWSRQEELAELIPNSTKHCFPNTGHFSYIADPKGYAAVIIDWWRSRKSI